MTIVDFILLRIEEDEILAERLVNSPLPILGPDPDDPVVAYLKRWSPWHTLSLCVLRRQRLSAHRPVHNPIGGLMCLTCDDRRGRSGWPCRTLRLLANEWVDHPDFREEWGFHGRPALGR